MSDYLDTLQTQFVEASRNLGQRRRRRWRRRGAGLVIAAVIVAGPALAATGVWRPPIGNGDEPAPRISREAPPDDQRSMLGVLRRPQTAADRGAATLDALRLISAGAIDGVRTDSIRLLAKGPHDRGLVLVPVARYAPAPPPIPADTPAAVRRKLTQPAIDNALCLFQLDSPDGAGVACWSSSDVREGRAAMSLGHRAAWLVPDGVSTVRTDYPNAPAIEMDVHENLALFSEPSGRHGDPTTTFVAGDRTKLRTITPPAPPPGTTRGFPAATDPIPRDATHSGGVRRIAITGRGLDARYELLIEQPDPHDRRPRFIWIALERPACAGDRHVTEMIGAITGRRFQTDIHPSTGEPAQARWCPGTYRGSLRYQQSATPFGTFSFRVR